MSMGLFWNSGELFCNPGEQVGRGLFCCKELDGPMFIISLLFSIPYAETVGVWIAYCRTGGPSSIPGVECLLDKFCPFSKFSDDVKPTKSKFC